MTTGKKILRKINNFIDYLEKIGSKWWGMLLLSSFPFLIILAPFLFGGQIFLKGDLVNWIYPIYHFYKISLANGDSILWNPNNFSGFPSFIGSMGFLAPLHYLLFQLLPLFIAYNLIVFLNATLALFFTWLLLKKFNLSSWVGFIGGLVYVFSQWSWVPNIAISNALPILPLLFLIIWRVKEKNDNWSILFGSLLIGWGWLSVHSNWLVMILSAGFLFSLWLGWASYRKLSLPLKFFLMVLIGTLVGLFIILPLLNYSALSARSAGLSYQQAAIGMLNFGDFLRYFLPYFQTSIFNLAASPAQLYLGILPLFFLIFALKFKSSLIHFFSFLFFLCLLLSISYSPLFWLLHQLPIFSSFRGPHRWMFIGSLAAAVLVGFGIEYFLVEGKDKWKKLLLKIFKWVGWSLLFISIIVSLIFYFLKDKFIFLTQDYFDRHLYGQTSGLPIEYYHRFIEGIFSELEQLFNLGNPKVFLPIIFILISYFVLSYFYKKKVAAKHFFPIIILIILLNFLSVFVFYHPITSIKDFSRQPTTVKFLKEQIAKIEPDQAKRIFSFLPGFSEYNKLTVPYQPKGIESFIFQSEILTPNLNLFYGLESVDYYDNLMSRSMSQILALIGSDRATIGEKLADLDIPPEEKVKKLAERKELLNLLGVRYIISVFPLDGETFPKVFESNIPPYNIPVYIYENKEARPLFYFAEEGEIILEERENSLVKLRINSETDQWFIFSENHLPGWRAYLNDQEIEIYTINSVYMGVFVPAGQHQILFKYNPYIIYEKQKINL